MSVLVAGDLNPDIVIHLDAGPDGKQRAPRSHGGGSAANTAAALVRLGIPVRFLGTVGDDGFGRAAGTELAAAGVDVSRLRTVSEPSTVVVIVAVVGGGERRVYVWPHRGGAHLALAQSDVATALADRPDWIHVSGICLRGTPAREALLELMGEGRERGIPVSIDLNLRLEAWGWDDGFREVAMRAVDLADVVLGSGSEEIAPLAGVGGVVAAAERLAGGRRTVVARLGREGAVAVDAAGRTLASPGFAVAPIDTVGAGDAFTAGFIAATLGGGDLTTALRQANAVAALSVSAEGARAGPTPSELARLLDRVPPP